MIMKNVNSDFMETQTVGTVPIFAERISSMLEIDDSVYAGVAEAVGRVIGEAGFFSGSVDYECDAFCSTFTATLLIYRQNDVLPEGVARSVSDVVPVWWEFSTTLPDGEGAVNDFCFSELKEPLIANLR